MQQHGPAHSPLIRRLLVRLVAPTAGSAVIAIAALAGGVWTGLAAVSAVLLIGAAYSLREQQSGLPERARLAPSDHPWARQLDRLARRAGVETPPLYLDPCWGTLACAFGVSRASTGILVEGGVLRGLSLSGAAGLLAHELGHIAANDMRHALLDRVSLLSVARLVQLGGFFVATIVPLPAALLLFAAAWFGPLHLVHMIEAAIQRRRELAADSFAARLVGPTVVSRQLSEITAYDEALRDWAQTLAEAQQLSLWERLTRSLSRASADAGLLLAQMEHLDAEAERAAALIDAPPPARGDLVSHTARLRRLLNGLSDPRRAVAHSERRVRPLQAGWAALTSTHPATEERLRRLQR